MSEQRPVPFRLSVDNIGLGKVEVDGHNIAPVVTSVALETKPGEFPTVILRVAAIGGLSIDFAHALVSAEVQHFDICADCGAERSRSLIAEDRRSDAREAMADVVEQAAAMDGEP